MEHTMDRPVANGRPNGHDGRLGGLAQDVLRDLGNLGSGLAEMAKEEASRAAKIALKRAILLAAAGIFALFALFDLVRSGAFFWAADSSTMAAGYLASGLVFLVIALIAGVLGLKIGASPS